MKFRAPISGGRSSHACLRISAMSCIALANLLAAAAPAAAIYLDDARSLSFRMRVYTQASMATQHYEVQSDPPTGVGQIVSQRNFFNPEFDAKWQGYLASWASIGWTS